MVWLHLKLVKSIRLFVSDIDFEREEIETEDGEVTYKNNNLSPKVYINPKITKTEGEILYEEGCLSVPGVYEEVKRFEKITLEYQDLEGVTHSVSAEGLSRFVCNMNLIILMASFLLKSYHQ